MAHAKFVIPLLLFAFITWIVYMAGIAGLQSECGESDAAGTVLGLNGVWGFSPGVLPCSKIFRWSWFIMAFEFVIIVGLLISTAVGRLWHARLAFIGLFSIATLLFMVQSESYLTLTDAGPYNGADGTLRARARVAAAGAIMTVVSNIFVILALGLDTAVLATTTAAGAGYATTDKHHHAHAAPVATTGTTGHTVPATAV